MSLKNIYLPLAIKKSKHNNIIYSIDNNSLTINNNTYHLRETDRKVLVSLLNNKNRSLTYEDMINEIWGESHHKDPMNVLHCSVFRLRKILINENFSIKTTYGVGYYIDYHHKRRNTLHNAFIQEY